MAQLSKHGLPRRRQAHNASHYEPPVFTTMTALLLGAVTGLSIVVLILVSL
jgi:hypothetical protein